MERDREKCARKPSKRIARLMSDEALAKLEAAVSAGRAPQWQLDLVRSARLSAQAQIIQLERKTP
jgi:hypothetical protein